MAQGAGLVAELAHAVVAGQVHRVESRAMREGMGQNRQFLPCKHVLAAYARDCYTQLVVDP